MIGATALLDLKERALVGTGCLLETFRLATAFKESRVPMTQGYMI